MCRALGLMLAITMAATMAAQTVVDRTVSKVNGRVILESEVRQARLLKLVTPVTDSDEDVLYELENRLLVLAEVKRLSALDATLEEINARRRDWERRMGSADKEALLAETHMTDAVLLMWFRDDAQIQRFLANRFGRQPDPAAESRRWMRDLRRRAGLRVPEGG